MAQFQVNYLNRKDFCFPKSHGPLNPRAAFTKNTNLVFKRDLGWEATENYIARSRIIKYGCHWDKVNFEAVRKCTFLAIMGIVIKSSIKIHLGCSLQKQAKFSIQLIVFTTMISDIIVKNIILKICIFIYCIDHGESKGVDFESTTKK